MLKSIVLTTLLAASMARRPPCQRNWLPFGERLCYFFSTESKMWFEARSECLSRGGSLAAPINDEQHDFIVQAAATLVARSTDSNGERLSFTPFWVDAVDFGGADDDERPTPRPGSERQFTYYENSLAVEKSQAHWAPGQPDNGTLFFGGGVAEGCVAIGIAAEGGEFAEFYADEHGKWIDRPCMAKESDYGGFVCEKVRTRHGGLVNGDMYIDASDEVLASADTGALIRDHISDHWRHPNAWPEGTVPVKVDARFASSQKTMLRKVMVALEIKAGKCDGRKLVSFVPYQGSEPNFVTILYSERHSTCASAVIGMAEAGSGGQKVLLGDGCFKPGVLFHELLHVLGFAHEHQRPDRDDNVEVIAVNILPNAHEQFERFDDYIDGWLDSPYDVGSIMHYKHDAFSFMPRTLATIKPKNISLLRGMGQRKRLSANDITRIKTLYSCERLASDTICPTPALAGASPPPITVFVTITEPTSPVTIYRGQVVTETATVTSTVPANCFRSGAVKSQPTTTVTMTQECHGYFLGEGDAPVQLELLILYGGQDHRSYLKSAGQYDTNDGSFRELPNMSVHRHGVGSAALGGNIYAIGGRPRPRPGFMAMKTCEMFNWKTQTWQPIASMKVKRHYPATVALGGALYAIGGDNERQEDLDSVERYDPATDSWSDVADLPGPRHTAVATVLGDCIFLSGGEATISYKTTYATVFQYCLSAPRWEAIAPLATGRYLHGATALDGRLYVCGGFNKFRAKLATCECYDTRTNEWNEVASLPTARSSLVMTTVNGQILAMGGNDASGYLSDVLAYDPATDSWHSLGAMPSIRAGFGVAILSIDA